MGKKSKKKKDTGSGGGGDGGGRKVITPKGQAASNKKQDDDIIDIQAKCEKRLAELVLAEKKGSKMNKLRFSIVAAEDAGVGELCPFCRAPNVGGKEFTLRMNKRIGANDPEALSTRGKEEAQKGNFDEAMGLLQRSADLGLCTAHFSH